MALIDAETIAKGKVDIGRKAEVSYVRGRMFDSHFPRIMLKPHVEPGIKQAKSVILLFHGGQDFRRQGSKHATTLSGMRAGKRVAR